MATTKETPDKPDDKIKKPYRIGAPGETVEPAGPIVMLTDKEVGDHPDLVLIPTPPAGNVSDLNTYFAEHPGQPGNKREPELELVLEEEEEEVDIDHDEEGDEPSYVPPERT